MVKADWWRVLALASLVLGIAQAVTVVVAISARNLSWVPATLGLVCWYWIGVMAAVELSPLTSGAPPPILTGGSGPGLPG